MLAAGFLISYWLIMKCLPIPGIGTGVLEKGKNFSAYIDSLCLSGHMWSQTKTWIGGNCEHASCDSNDNFRRVGRALPLLATFKGRKNGMDVRCRKYPSPRRCNAGYVAAD